MFISDFSSADKSSAAKEMNRGDKAENTLKQANRAAEYNLVLCAGKHRSAVLDLGLPDFK